MNPFVRLPEDANAICFDRIGSIYSYRQAGVIRE